MAYNERTLATNVSSDAPIIVTLELKYLENMIDGVNTFRVLFEFGERAKDPVAEDIENKAVRSS